MMKKLSLFVALAAACALCLTGCSGQPAPAAQPEVGFVLFTGDEPTDGMTLEERDAIQTTATAFRWNMTTGEITAQEEPMAILRGTDYADTLLAWDGETTVMLRARNAEANVVEKSDAFDYVEYRGSGSGIAACGYDHEMNLTAEGLCTLTTADQSKTFDLAPSFAAAHPELADTAVHYLSSQLSGSTLRIVFKIHPEDGVRDGAMLYVTVDTQTDAISWSDEIALPRQYDAGHLVDPYSVCFVSDRLYFSSRNSICALDLATNQIISLENITDALDTLFPGAVRASAENVVAVEDTSPVGGTRELVICQMSLYQDDQAHALYYAVQGDQLLGVMSLDMQSDGSASLSAYNGALELLRTTDLNGLNVKFPVRFQSAGYP